MLAFISLLSYLGVFALFHGDDRRCAIPGLNRKYVPWVRAVGYLLLVVSFFIAGSVWGAERGIALMLAALSLAAPLSLLLATRWPRWHAYSAPIALLSAGGILAL